jgi:hypothetical protein
MVKDSPGRGYRSFIHGSFIRIRRTGFGTTAADSEKDVNSAAHPGLTNLRALGLAREALVGLFYR